MEGATPPDFDVARSNTNMGRAQTTRYIMAITNISIHHGTNTGARVAGLSVLDTPQHLHNTIRR